VAVCKISALMKGNADILVDEEQPAARTLRYRSRDLTVRRSVAHRHRGQLLSFGPMISDPCRRPKIMGMRPSLGDLSTTAILVLLGMTQTRHREPSTSCATYGLAMTPAILPLHCYKSL
jgi:hypothetical protein